MAILSRITCERCGAAAEVNHSPADPAPKICGACSRAEVDAERAEHFAQLAALRTEERLRRVEEWIYDFRPQWLPPPRF